MLKNLSFKIAILSLVFLFTLNTAKAVDYWWVGLQSTNWATSGNWYNLSTPGYTGTPSTISDNAFIGVTIAGNNPTVTTSITCHNLTIGNDATHNIPLTQSSGTLTISGILTAGNYSTITLSGTGALTVTGAATNDGIINQNGSGAIIFSSSLNNTGGTLHKTGSGTITFTGAVTNGTGGIITQNGATGLITFSNTLNNTGTVTQSAAGGTTFAGVATNNANGIINQNAVGGTTMAFTATPVNAGTINQTNTGGLTFNNATTSVTNTGTINRTGTGAISFASPVANTGGTIIQGSTTLMTFPGIVTSSGTIRQTAAGGIKFTVGVTNTGTISQESVGGGAMTFTTTLNNSGGTISQTNNNTGTITFTQTVTNNTTSYFTFHGGTSTFTANFSNSGTLTNAGPGTVNFNGTFTNTNAVILTGGATIFSNTPFTNSGTFTASVGSVNFDQGANQTITNNSTTPVRFNNLNFSGGTFTKAFSGTGKFEINSMGTITIATTTIFNPGAALLTLKSDANGTASIAALPTPASNITTAATVHVERFVTGNNSTTYRGYRLMSSPVNSGGFANLNYLAANTIITGATSSLGTIGGNPTIYLYNETLPVNNTSFVSGNFVGVKDITTTNLGTLSGSTSGNTHLPAGNGFFLYFRGDKTTNAAHKTVVPFAPADDVTFTASGTLNTGTIVVNNWFGSNLSNTNTSAAAKGFNLVGNPYASTIDWDKYLIGADPVTGNSSTSAIPHTGISKTIYMYTPSKRGYSVYMAGNGGVATNSDNTTTPSANLISAGQGFFVKANPTAVTPTLSFTELAKTSTQASGTNLLLSTEPIATGPVLQYLRIQVLKDKLNTDDALIFFKKDAKTEYVENEDAGYLKGNTIVNISTQSSDKVALAINQTALPKTSQTKIDLNVTITSNGIYQLNIPEMKNIPQLYDVWLMDALKKDSLDIKHNPTYNFNAVTADAATFSKRFSLVIRQNPAYAYRLLDFNGALTTAGTVQLNWKTENEETYTYFTVERSTSGGKTFDVLGSEKAVSQNTYSLVDKTPVVGENLYRLKQEDINGVVTYSPVVRIMYSLSNNTPVVTSNVSVYPNPASSTLNLVVTKKTTVATIYNISVTSATGRVVKNIVASQPDWQGDVSSFLPGTYFVQVINANDKSLVGKTTFVKL